MITIAQCAEALRVYCETRGVDYETALADASRHFQGPIVRRTEPLTPEELEMLAADDEAVFGS